MDGKYGICASFNIATQALQSYSFGIGVVANNIANISTSGFEADRAAYATRPHGQGVQVMADKGINIKNSQEATKELSQKAQNGIDLAREIPHLISTQRSFEANAKSIKAFDEISGTILNTVI